MPYPKLADDGDTVVLDLHGARVDEAVDLAKRAVREAARRGRSRVRLIHGSSTSSRLHPNRTIKHALYELLEEGAFSPHVTGAWRTEDVLALSLDVTAARDPMPLHLRDLLR